MEDERQPPTESDRSELQLLYNVSVADVSFFKNQHWVVTNYAVLVQAALVAFAVALKPIEPWERIGVLLLLVAAAALGLFTLQRLSTSIFERRQRLRKVRTHFGSHFYEAWKVSKVTELTPTFLGAVQVVAAILAIYLVAFGD